MTPEQNARAYLEAIGLDPDEIVFGADMHGRCRHPRWVGMLGAYPALAEGREELSPNQVALLARQRGRLS